MDVACLWARWLSDLSDPFPSWSCKYAFANFEVSSEANFHAADMGKKKSWTDNGSVNL